MENVRKSGKPDARLGVSDFPLISLRTRRSQVQFLPGAPLFNDLLTRRATTSVDCASVVLGFSRSSTSVPPLDSPDSDARMLDT